MLRGMRVLVSGIALAGFTLAGAAVASAQEPAKPVLPLEGDRTLIILLIKPDKTADFEAVVARLAQALEANPDPARRQQAAAWRILRSSEPGRDSVVYVFLLDPVVPGADYDPVRVLSESLPAEVQPLYEKLKAAVVRVERLPLTKIR